MLQVEHRIWVGGPDLWSRYQSCCGAGHCGAPPRRQSAAPPTSWGWPGGRWPLQRQGRAQRPGNRFGPSPYQPASLAALPLQEMQRSANLWRNASAEELSEIEKEIVLILARDHYLVHKSYELTSLVLIRQRQTVFSNWYRNSKVGGIDLRHN